MGTPTKKKARAKSGPDLEEMASLFDILSRECDEAHLRLGEHEEAFGAALLAAHGETPVVIGRRFYRAYDSGGGIVVEDEPCVVRDATVDSGR